MGVGGWGALWVFPGSLLFTSQGARERRPSLVGAGHVSPREKLDLGRGPSLASLCQFKIYGSLQTEASALLCEAHAKLIQLAIKHRTVCLQ